MKKKKINLLIENGTPKKIKDDAIVRLHINYWVEPSSLSYEKNALDRSTHSRD